MADSGNPYVGPIADLVNPYITPESGHTGGMGGVPGTEYAEWWMRTHPGRWAQVGEGSLGMTKHCAERLGLEAGFRSGKHGAPNRVFARQPHPQGEDLATALLRHKEESLDLPELVRSAFEWTLEELAEAAAVARENLFPVATKGAP